MGNLRSSPEEPKHVILRDYDLDIDEGRLGDAGTSVHSTEDEDEEVVIFARRKRGKCAWLAICCCCCRKARQVDEDELLSEEEDMRVVESMSNSD